MIVGAVVLIYDDGILNIVHYNVLEQNIPNEPVAWSGPCLYPHPIIRAREDGIRQSHIFYSFFVQFLPQTSNAVFVVQFCIELIILFIQLIFYNILHNFYPSFFIIPLILFHTSFSFLPIFLMIVKKILGIG